MIEKFKALNPVSKALVIGAVVCTVILIGLVITALATGGFNGI